MKKYISIFAIIISATFNTGCNDYLEEEVETFIEEEVVFTTEEGLESAINGLYASYAGPGYHGSSIHTFIAPVSGKFFSNQGASQDATSLNTLPNNTWLTRMWPQMYTTVNVANIIIANIEESNLPNKDRALGEAYFLRGATYFDLVRYFGGVPLKLLPASIDNLNTPRSSKEEVYDAIISDFENAKLMLPNTGEALFQRPVKLAANMFLAKVYMTLASETNNMEMWQAAYDEAIQVYGQYSLVPTFAELYNPLNENTVESIFEIQYATNGAVRNSDIIRSYTLKQFYEYPTFGRIRPNKEVYDQHLNQYPGDPRIAATFIYDSYTKVNGNNQNLYPIQINGNDGYTGLKKYLEPNFNGSTTNRNMLKLRYADLLLMLAEIENELNGPGGAYQYVNEVLARARTQADGTQAAEPADWSGMSQDEFRTRILRERQYELLGENHEWFDTRRRGYEYFLEEVIETHNN
ncbi:RagB/SusD family nutrient uptake outer membrane protein, partial [Flavobacteriaceae bacterium]|nr:RagB/SusD family nutrient uptake outer membrane protein [Flavobacteriaceae bacterium]